mmetsp:Transcript_29282/g.40965  ORF Transcript_29282/g.40965 Transcript_29282/m.40965 type:complete len:100 (+) Transcript_29282:28-327(+)
MLIKYYFPYFHFYMLLFFLIVIFLYVSTVSDVLGSMYRARFLLANALVNAALNTGKSEEAKGAPATPSSLMKLPKFSNLSSLSASDKSSIDNFLAFFFS